MMGTYLRSVNRLQATSAFTCRVAQTLSLKYTFLAQIRLSIKVKNVIYWSNLKVEKRKPDYFSLLFKVWYRNKCRFWKKKVYTLRNIFNQISSYHLITTHIMKLTITACLLTWNMKYQIKATCYQQKATIPQFLI